MNLGGRLSRMALGKDYAGQECAIASALELVGERWTLLIIRDAFYGVGRYNDFLAHLGLPRAVLSARLSALTAAGVLRKQRYCDGPPRYEYVLTATGRELWPTLFTLSAWGERHLLDSGAKRVFHHVSCGATLDRYAACPDCGVTPPPEDLEVRPGPGIDAYRADDPVSRALLKPHRLLTPLSA